LIKNKYVRKSLKILLWTVGSIVGVLLLVVLLIQVPYIQDKIKDKAVAYLEGKIHTKVAISHINLGLPKNVVIEGVYLESQQKDTLLYAGEIDVNISLFKLIDSQVEINSVALSTVTANIRRDKDSVFNFDYIIKAFESKEAPDPNAKPTKISVDKIKLDKIRFKFDDAITKNDLTAYIHHFDTRFEKFDLDKLYFDVPKITLDGLTVKLKQGQLVQEIAQKTNQVADSLANKTSLQLKLGDIALSKIKIGYDSKNAKLNTGLMLEKSLIRFNNFDIQKQIIDLQGLDITSLKGRLTIGKFEKKMAKNIAASDSIVTTKPWKIKLNQTSLKKIAFRFDDENAAPTAKGIDFKHLDIRNFNLDGEKFNYTGDVISGNIYAFTVQDKSGLNVQSLKTQFYYGKKSAHLKKLYLKTPQTTLRDELVVGYPSIESIGKNIGELNVNASIKGSQIGFKDLLIFAPDLAKNNPFKSNPDAIMKINSRVFGKVKDIEIPNLEISGIGSTKIAASGRITGLPDAENAYFDLVIRDFNTSAKDINSFVPPNTLPTNIQLPQQLAVHGTFKGKINDFITNLNVNSSYGAAKIKANFDNKRKNHEKYDADAELKSFDLGKLIKNKDVGKISLRAKVKGTSLNPKTANAVVRAKIASAVYNQYNYRNADLKGKITNGVFEADVAMADPNLTFDLVSSGSFRDKYPAVKLKLNADMVDLEKLNLHAGPMKLKGQLEADIPTADPDYLNGNIVLHHFRMANDKQDIAIDSVIVMATATPERNAIAVKSPILDATVEGKYKLTQIGDAITNSISRYYDFNPKAKKKKTQPQLLAFNAVVKNNPVIFQLLPELKSLEPIAINGRYNSENDTIILNTSIPKIVYGANNISNAVAKVDTKDDSLVYNVLIDDIKNAQVDLPYTNISGSVKDNVIAYTVLLKDVKDKDRYLLAGQLRNENGDTEIKLADNLILNYEAWNMVPDNRIRFGRNGIYARDFVLSKDTSSITIQSQSETPDAPLAVDFKDFKIETITNIIQKDSLVMSGNINGNALVKNINTNPVFTADMKVSDFTFNHSPVGNIDIQVNNETANTYAANVAISGQDNNVNLDGKYFASSKSFDLDLDLQKLNVKSIQGFTMGQVTQGSGYFNGKFKITGTAAAPKVNGNLKFNDIALRVTQLNSYFKSMNDNIVVNEKGINFDTFSVSDEENNLLIVDGNLATNDYTNYGFDLSIKADNFKAVNSKEKDNQLYYGQLYLNTRLQVKGDLDKPIVSGRIKINEDTKFVVVLPQQDPSIEDREGIVEFIDQDNPELNKTVVVNDSIGKTKIRGIDASVNIEIDKEAELSLVIDKANGDFIKLKGEARLNAGMDPSGKTTLTGKYEFTEGSYEMTFNLLKRKFDIKEGSYILWTGEPTQADVSVTAVYKTQAAPIDLVGDQIGNVSEEVRNTYKQRIPFETNLIMKGQLLKPEITFDIVLPEGNNTVSTEIINNTQIKLAQLRQEPSELNKQVFALLLLNRFIAENPFSSETGGATAETLARQSASKILSQQLNNLAGDLIKGVELDFDLESTDDYTTGQRQNRTDLNVGVTKKLLDDRLKVTVGSSFGVEGQRQANQETNNLAGDISAEYQLTKDGRYRVRAYRKNQYQVALQGQVVETGVAFTITMNYNKFRELFQKSREQLREEKKEKEKKEAAKKKKDENK
jgi:hypothetical protein